MSCLACKRDIKIIARGYCRACYQRWQKRGTTDYAPLRHRTFCQIDDCGKPVVSNGMCGMHRQRLIKTGTTDQSEWGSKTRHPLYNSWAFLMRHRSRDAVSPRWHEFMNFAVDLGERPSRKHKLFAANDSMPIGPSNFVWKEAVTQKVDGEDERTYMNRAQKIYRAVRKEAFQGYELKRRFGLSKADYDAMSQSQDGKCAICGDNESRIMRGQKMALAVDHCHKGGHVRGLLCSGCNTGLGSFQDDMGIMQRAILYLEKHTLPPPEE